MSEIAHIPQLRFPEFSGEWEEKRLGDIADFSKGKGISKSDIDNDGQLECIRYGELYTTYNELIKDVHSKTNIAKEDVKLSQIGDVIIPASGETAIDIATASCVLKDGVAIGGDLNIIRSDIDGVFNAYYLNNKNKYSVARLSQGSSVIHLYAKHLETLKLNLPTKPEQTKIASFLTAVDNKIEQLSKKQELLGEYKKGLMQQIFSQAIRFKANDGSDFPDWEEKKLGDLSVVISDGNYGELYPTSSDFKLTGVPFLRANNIKSLKIDGTDTKYITEEQHSLLTSGHLQTNDILITTRGVLGNLAIVESTHNGSNINAQICLLRVTNTSELNHFYLLFVLDHRDSKKQYKAFETGTALKQLPKGNLRKIKLKLPTLFEQNKIANFLSSIDTKIEQVDKQLDESKQFKKALLQQMFV